MANTAPGELFSVKGMVVVITGGATGKSIITTHSKNKNKNSTHEITADTSNLQASAS
jgi:hypothetical protein